MNYYHMTSLDRLKSIGKMGLLPRNEDNYTKINEITNMLKKHF